MNVARGCGYVQHYRERGNMVCLCSYHSIGMEPDRERGTVVRGHGYAVVMGMEPTGRGGLLLGGVAMLPLRWNLQLCRRGRILIGALP